MPLAMLCLVALVTAMAASGSAVPQTCSYQRFPVLMVQRLRGGSSSGASQTNDERGLLVIDLGAQNTRAAMSALPGCQVQGLSSDGVPVLVQNDMSKLDTPTAVAFRGNKCEVGELAADQPANNVHNRVADFMPHLGLDQHALANHLIPPTFTPADPSLGGTPPRSNTAAAVVQYKDQAVPVALELAVALQVAAMEKYACTQVVSQGGKAIPPRYTLALTVPTFFNARQICALHDASVIAGFGRPVLVAAADALALEYRKRHQDDLSVLLNATGGTRHVAFVDIGHASACVSVVRYSLDNGEVQAKVISASAEVGAGAGFVDDALLALFSKQLDEKHGAGTCSGPKARWRLRKACERIKKMLSTIDATRVSVDGLMPDEDVTLDLSRGQLESVCEPLCARLAELLHRVVAACDFGEESAVDVVEIVGGGTRIPCVASTIQEAFGGLALARTLDSNTAVCLGSWAAAAARFPTTSAEGRLVGEPRLGPVEQAVLEMGGKGMEEEARVHLRGMLLEIQADQRRLHEAEASRNELEALLAEMRAALQGRLGHAELMQADATRVILDDTQTWLDEQDTLDTSVTATDAILARTQNVQAQLRELNKAFFDRLKAEKEASTAGLESEAARRRAEEAVADKDDHDTRPLKFEDRIRMAENNKKEGNELFRDGNLMHSLERYSKALAHCFKVVGDLTPKQHVRLLDCKGSLSLNLAQCYYKLGKWHKAVDSCSDVVKYLNSSSSTTYNADPDQDGVTQVEFETEGPELTANWANVRLKAMLRRGLAHEKLNMTDHQLSDAQAVLDVDADNASALGLLARAQAKRAAHMKAEKAMARKMFG